MAANVQDSSLFTRRGVVLVAIIAFHVLLAYAFASGLAQKVVEVLAPPIEADIVEELKPEDAPPPPPPPEMERPPVEVPPPEVTIDLPMETSTAIVDVTDKPPPPAPPPPPRAPTVAAKIVRSPFPEEYYPPGAKRREEEGSPVVRACVGANGRLVREPVVTDTSGFPELDGAAIKVAKDTRYMAGSDAESCVSFRVKFVLKNN